LKKAETKNADAVSFGSLEVVSKKDLTNKSESKGNNTESLAVKVVINTTNFLDSHGDVHINGIWNKSISDNVSFLHSQEHNRSFDKIISDSAKGYTQLMTWKELGLSYEGSTEALIFDSIIEKKRNEFMLNQYSNGWVKNHSVGMRYVKLELAINSDAEWDKEEKAVWDKYYYLTANKDVADEKGYFWAVTEAKIIEGSAVVMGSNSATPTLENKNTQEPSNDTPVNEPSNDTQTEEKKNYYKHLI